MSNGFLFSFLLIIYSAGKSEGLELPKISAVFYPPTSTYSNYTTSNFTTFQNESILVLNRVGSWTQIGTIILHCNASYPVTWTMDSVEDEWVRGVMGERQVGNFSDPSSYNYSLSLKLIGEPAVTEYSFVHKYICREVGNGTDAMDLKSEFTILKEKLSMPYWNLNQTVSPIVIPLNSTEQNEVRVPCFPLNLNESMVQLYKVVDNNTLALLEQSETLRFKELDGFYLNSSAISSDSEQFVCVISLLNETNPLTDLISPNTTISEKLGNNFHAMFQIDKDKEPIPSNTTSNITSLFLVRTTYGGTACCHPRIHYISNRYFGMRRYSCNEPLICLTKKALHTLSIPTYYSDRYNDTCVYISSSTASWTPTIVLCKNTAGVKELFISSEEILGSYEDSIQIEHGLGYRFELFEGQQMTMTCGAQAFYYARGIFWEILYRNGTGQIIPGTPAVNSWNSFYLNKVRLVLNLEKDIVGVNCLAPTWNTTEWKNKTLKLNVQEPIAPTSPSGRVNIVQNITFYNGQTGRLDCEFTGNPTPKYYWTKPSEGFTSSPYTYNNNVKLLHVEGDRSYTDANVNRIFKCVASNFGGNATKIFNVTSIASFSPIIQGGKKETVVFYTGEEHKTINCSLSQGIPLPSFEWSRFGHSIGENESEVPHIEIRTKEEESQLYFEKVIPELEGEYECSTDNFKGTSSKIFILRIRDRIQSRVWLEVSVIALSIALIIVIAGYVYLQRRTSKQIGELQVEFKKTMDKSESMATIATRIH